MTESDTIGLILGGIFTVGTTALLLLQHLLGPRPKLRGYWDRPARVRVAASASIDLLLITREAVALWRAQGAPLLESVVREGPDDPVAGEIVLVGRVADFDADHTGETITSYFADWTIRKAQCRIRVTKIDVVCHEIGHALGFEHVSKQGHVLNRLYSKLGLSFVGCREALAAYSGESSTSQ